jgi:thioredoxin 1
MGGNIINLRKYTLKVVVPIMFIIILLGIWHMKNTDNNISGVNNDNPDFALHVTEEIDLEKLKSYGIPIIIDFGADSCIPCKEMAPVLIELNEELRGKAIIKFLDVWKYPALVKGYPVNLIPTQLFIDANGNPYRPKDSKTMGMKLYSIKDTGEHVLTTHEGGMTKEQLLKALKEMGMK